MLPSARVAPKPNELFASWLGKWAMVYACGRKNGKSRSDVLGAALEAGVLPPRGQARALRSAINLLHERKVPVFTSHISGHYYAATPEDVAESVRSKRAMAMSLLHDVELCERAWEHEQQQRGQGQALLPSVFSTGGQP